MEAGSQTSPSVTDPHLDPWLFFLFFLFSTETPDDLLMLTVMYLQ